MNKPTESANVKIRESATALEVILIFMSFLTLLAMYLPFSRLVDEIFAGTLEVKTVLIALAYPFYLIIQLVAVQTFRRIAKLETPFIPLVARNIKIIAVLILCVSTIPHWVGEVAKMIINGDKGFTFLDGPAALGVLMFLIFNCLGAIFDYGCQLQRQDDELL